jgi:hypothetical protein
VLLAGCTQSSSQTGSLFGSLAGPEENAKPAQAPTAQAAAPYARAQPDRSGCGSADQCRHTLKTMIDSPDRGWIGQRQTPDVYANGTRLFAYRALRRQLTCGELSAAVEELSAASRSLGGTVAGMSSEQQTRTRALCSQVEGELAKEREGRCRT